MKRPLILQLSRLAGSWVLQDHPNANAFIMKGEEINNNKDLGHDILLIESQSKFYTIDPAIWQFFKNSKNILVKITDSMENVHQDLERKYSGCWKISEKLGSVSEEQMNGWKKIIQKNIEEIDLDI